MSNLKTDGCLQGVAYAVEGLVNTAQNSSDDQGILNNVSSSAEEAQKALDELIRFIKQTPLSTQQDGKLQNDTLVPNTWYPSRAENHWLLFRNSNPFQIDSSN
jgi:hypothetical protein